MQQNIAAFTAPTVDQDYVPFISINRAGEHEELVSISVRQKGNGEVPHAEIAMTKAEFALLLLEAQKNI